jgi:UDP-3-O-[3-hydroxymyristoyl] glucosamine N-acyltransferase
LGDPGCTEIDKDLVVVQDPYYSLATLLGIFEQKAEPVAGVHPTAIVEDGAQVAASASVGAYAVIGRDSRVDEGATLHPHVVIGKQCVVGKDAILYPRVVLYDHCEVGARSILHSGVVLGSDGFGYALHQGRHEKLPHIGKVVVEEDVEIGANTTVDRGLLDETRLGAGSKIDNLVQVAHNVRLGRGCILVSQSGLSGSTRLGNGVVMAGQSGAAGHLELGDGAQVAAKSAVFKSVPSGQTVAGIPAGDAAGWRRQQALTRRLAELFRRLKALEAKSVGEGQEKSSE